jgi:hypothetical protein
MKSRGLDTSDQACIENAASRRSSCHWLLGISRTSPWRRFVFPLMPLSALTTIRQNLRDEVAMDVDEEDEGGHSTQRPRRVPDYGIEVDFDILSGDERGVRRVHNQAIHGIRPSFLSNNEQDSSGEVLGEFDASIAKLNAEIERMTPNMKAMDRYVFFSSWYCKLTALHLGLMMSRLSSQRLRGRPIRRAGTRRTHETRSMT